MPLLPSLHLRRPLDVAAERAVRSRFGALERGTLTVSAAGRSTTYGEARDATDPAARLTVRDPRFWRSLALRGSIGAAESFVRGEWTSEELVDVVRLFARNRSANMLLERGGALLSRPFLALGHALRANTRSGSRRNIAAHYDLSNEFFALVLDESMTYSSAIWKAPTDSLHAAQLHKVDRLLDLLAVSPGDHILEIGTGWGALAIRAAGERGCRVTTTTISPSQHREASERVRRAGLADRVEILLTDYRDLDGRFDGIVSVEMIEAIGWRQYPTFFARCDELLAPGRKLAVQAITIADRHYDQARRSVDFIQRHVFPGSCIPSVSALCDAAARASRLTPAHLSSHGEHYVRTLLAWRENLRANESAVRALGFDDRFLRLWEYYLAYCAGGFAERQVDGVQLVFRAAE